jgi:hypothetical protein
LRLFTLSTAAGLAFAGQFFVGAYPAEAKIDRRHHDAWQTRVAQAEGRVTRDLQPPGKPGAAGKASAVVATAGQTCDSSNAATPYCYTATQQSLSPPEGELFASAQAARATGESRSAASTSPVSGKNAVGLAVLGALAASAR